MFRVFCSIFAGEMTKNTHFIGKIMSKTSYLIIFTALLFPSVLVAQTENRGTVTIVPEKEPESTQNAEFEEWLRGMPTTVAPNTNGILEPVEPVFLKDIPLKPGQGLVPMDYARLNAPVLSKEDAQMIYWGKQLEQQRKEPGAMTIGIPVLAIAQYLMTKILPDDWLKSPRERRLERRKKILEEYDDTMHVSKPNASLTK